MAKKVYSERQVRSQLMKQKIRDAARTLMRLKGYDAVTVDDICDEVGVTKGTFYNHFQSKEQMILDNIAEDNLYYRTKLRQMVTDKAPGLEKLISFLRLAIAYENGKDREFTRFSYKLRIADPKNAPAIYPDKRELYKITEELIAEGQACGEIRQDLGSDRLATIVLYAIRGVAYSWCLPDTDFDLIEVGEDLFEVLQEGLRKK
jgi:AcrR family transcriptional regulator